MPMKPSLGSLISPDLAPATPLPPHSLGLVGMFRGPVASAGFLDGLDGPVGISTPSGCHATRMVRSCGSSTPNLGPDSDSSVLSGRDHAWGQRSAATACPRSRCTRALDVFLVGHLTWRPLV